MLKGEVCSLTQPYQGTANRFSDILTVSPLFEVIMNLVKSPKSMDFMKSVSKSMGMPRSGSAAVKFSTSLCSEPWSMARFSVFTED